VSPSSAAGRELAELAAAGALALALVVASRDVLFPARSGPATAPAERPAAAAGPVERGRALFLAKGCAGCHAAPGITSRVAAGPDLSQGLAARAAARHPGLRADEYLRQSILDPSAFRVPGYEEEAMPRLALTGADVEALVAFLLDGG
jgi:cytochrome c oxidase subunit 2